MWKWRWHSVYRRPSVFPASQHWLQSHVADRSRTLHCIQSSRRSQPHTAVTFTHYDSLQTVIIAPIKGASQPSCQQQPFPFEFIYTYSKSLLFKFVSFFKPNFTWPASYFVCLYPILYLFLVHPMNKAVRKIWHHSISSVMFCTIIFSFLISESKVQQVNSW
jgi:hypothetical protein